MLAWTSRMRWCGTRSAYTNMLNLSRPPVIKRPTRIGFCDISIIVIVFCIHLITHRTRHHHFRSHKSCLCSIYLLLYLALFRLLLVSSRLHFFYLAPLVFVTHPHLPTPTHLHQLRSSFYPTFPRSSHLPPQIPSISGSSSSTLSPTTCSACFSP